MTDNKMLQMVLDRVNTIDGKVDVVKEEVVKNGKRIDKLGLDLAQLQDDAPTIEEHDSLDERVKKLEKE